MKIVMARPIGAASALAVALATSLFAEGSHDPRQLRRHAMKAVLGGALPAILVALTVILGAGLILRAFGSDYASSGATLLRLLALASLPYFLLNVYIGVARVEKNITAIVLVAGTMAAVSLAVGYPLVHSMGLQGIGIAWIAGQLSALAIAAAFFARGRLLPADGHHQSNKAFSGVVEDTIGGET